MGKGKGKGKGEMRWGGIRRGGYETGESNRELGIGNRILID